MNFGEYRFVQVDRSFEPVLANLFELYLHDMAEWFRFDTNATGKYADSVGWAWEDGGTAHAIYFGDIPVGFALLAGGEEFTGDPSSMDVEEFFVVRRHRRAGLGRAFAEYVWNLHPGPWVVRVFQANLPAIPFWRSTVAAFTDNRHHEETRVVNEHPWSYFTFAAGEPASFERH